MSRPAITDLFTPAILFGNKRDAGKPGIVYARHHGRHTPISHIPIAAHVNSLIISCADQRLQTGHEIAQINFRFLDKNLTALVDRNRQRLIIASLTTDKSDGYIDFR